MEYIIFLINIFIWFKFLVFINIIPILVRIDFNKEMFHINLNKNMIYFIIIFSFIINGGVPVPVLSGTGTCFQYFLITGNL
jgi:hypothetical protein